MLLNGSVVEVDTSKLSDGSFHLIVDGRSVNAEFIEGDRKTPVVSINGQRFETQIKDRYDRLLDELGMSRSDSEVHKDLKAPMPGLVLDVQVNEGQEIKKGDPLLILEAMKMENVIKSPGDAVVKSVQCKQGEAVEKNDVLIEFA